MENFQKKFQYISDMDLEYLILEIQVLRYKNCMGVEVTVYFQTT